MTFSSTMLSFMRAHVVSLAWGLVVGAAVIDWGLTFDTRLFASDFWDPTTLRQFPPDFVISPTYFLASVMPVMFWAILLNDSYDLLDDENSLTLSPMSLLRQSILLFFLFLGNNDRALCISRCKRNRTAEYSAACRSTLVLGGECNQTSVSTLLVQLALC